MRFLFLLSFYGTGPALWQRRGACVVSAPKEPARCRLFFAEKAFQKEIASFLSSKSSKCIITEIKEPLPGSFHCYLPSHRANFPVLSAVVDSAAVPPLSHMSPLLLRQHFFKRRPQAFAVTDGIASLFGRRIEPITGFSASAAVREEDVQRAVAVAAGQMDVIISEPSPERDRYCAALVGTE